MGLLPAAGQEPRAVSPARRSCAGTPHRHRGLSTHYQRCRLQPPQTLADCSVCPLPAPFPPLLPYFNPHLRLPRLTHPATPRHNLLLQILLVLAIGTQQARPSQTTPETPLPGASRRRQNSRPRPLHPRQEGQEAEDAHHKVHARVRLRDHLRYYLRRRPWYHRPVYYPHCPSVSPGAINSYLPRYRSESPCEPHPYDGCS